MPYNKVIYGGRTLIDLTSDTVSEATLAKGVTAHRADGTQITGTLEIDEGILPPSVDVIYAEGGGSEVTVSFEAIDSEYIDYLGDPAYVLVLNADRVPTSITDGTVVRFNSNGEVT